jgi:LmbE family N-acetylglucosaminyl deacetylase
MSNNHQVKRVMGIFAHPDDPEFFSGATFARWAAEGAEVIFILATSGDKGSADPEMTSDKLVQIREAEELNAARVLGVKEVIFLRHKDGELQPTLALRRDLVRLLRLKQPDIVVTCDPTVFWYQSRAINHPDHRAIGEATLDAVFPTARDRLNFPELERDEGLPVHKVKQVYLSGTNTVTKTVDVTAHVETKINSLREHKSQIANMDEMAQRVRERMLDDHSPEDAPRYIERFHVINLA